MMGCSLLPVCVRPLKKFGVNVYTFVYFVKAVVLRVTVSQR